MKKLEWFPFWAKDWVTDEAIIAMSAESRGIYITLLAHQWIEGSIPDLGSTLARFCGIDARSYRAKVEPVVRAHFIAVEGMPGRLVNERLRAERERQLEKRAQLARNGAVGAEHRWQKPSQVRLSLPKQLSSQGHGEAEEDAHQHLSDDRRKGSPVYPEAFEQAWAVYPKRAGGNSKRSALKAWSARVKGGVSPEEILVGVGRYRRYCEATKKVGTEYVKQASTFFGPDEHFREPWTIAGEATSPTAMTTVELNALEREANDG